MNFSKIIKNNSIIISVILGLGLAALFRRVCDGKKCIIVEGPPLRETEKYYYQIHENCYKYTPVVSECY
jgi:hypothetical protein